jgi:putative transposase
MDAVDFISPTIGTGPACAGLGIARATVYRHRRGHPKPKARPVPVRALNPAERQQVLDVLHSNHFMDKAPTEVYNALLDEGTYICSVRTMYRILEEKHEIRERRNQLRHPRYEKPQLRATAPNQVWTWDITKLLGPIKFVYFYLYVMIDLFSRYVVGWMAAGRESAVLAQRLIRETTVKYEIEPGRLSIHADRGGPMTALTTAQLMATLGVQPSYSRPHVSNDNPFSEAHFKTIKYRPDFPLRFGSMEHVLEHFNSFFEWYNNEHHHSGIAFLTPADVHFHRATNVISQRQVVLDRAHQLHPERFVRHPPQAPKLLDAVWINPPQKEAFSTQSTLTNFQSSVSQNA